MQNHSLITTVGIGIQARTTSVRFPNKILEIFGDKTVLDHVIDACKSSARYCNRHTHRTGVKLYVCLLVPENDVKISTPRPGVHVITGDENNVLSRYVKMQKAHEFDYVARVTADCPLMKPSLLSKAIMIAIKNQYDFVTNTMPGLETYYDGCDVQIVGKEMLNYISEEAKEDLDKEHVFTFLNKSIPPWAKCGMIFNDIDLSNIKLSVDTRDDLERVKQQYESVSDKIKRWSDKYGKQAAHRF